MITPIRASLSLLLVLACSGPVDPVEQLPGQAAYVIYPAYSGQQNYYLGRDTVSGRPAVLVRELSTYACTWTFVGGTDGQLNDTVRVTLGNMSDSFEVLTSPTTISCTNALGTWYYVTYGTVSNTSGYNLYVYGGTGNDYIDCNSTWNAAVFCYGYAGDDHLVNSVSNSHVWMYGGDGADTLISTAYNANVYTHLDGGYGYDCIASTVAPAATYDCGLQTYNNTKRSAHVLGANCTTIVTACP